MAQYSYDEKNQFFPFVLLTFLLLFLVPYTYQSITPPKKQIVPDFQVRIHDPKARRIAAKRRSDAKVPTVSLRYVLLFLGWISVALLGTQIARHTADFVLWDPYQILGMPVSASEKEIKKHYKRLSIKYHPDKVRLIGNQTYEDAETQFVELTKAYKALTDEEVRKNFIEYGHPDGKQDTAIGIALPVWMVEGSNSFWVLAAYCVILLIGVPVMVGRWWYRSSEFTKDGILTRSAELYFKELEDDMTEEQCLALLAKCTEFGHLNVSCREIDALEQRVVSTGGTSASGPSRAAEILLKAHVYRIDVGDRLAVQQTFILDNCILLHRGLLQTALAFGYLESTVNIMRILSSIVQAIPSSGPPLLQMPHIDLNMLNSMTSLNKASKIADFLRVPEPLRRSILPLNEAEYLQVLEVANAFPNIEILSAYFKVHGDKLVTPNAIVQFVLKVRQVGGPDLSLADLDEGDDDEAENGTNGITDKRMLETAEPDSLSWCPYFPSPKKAGFWLFIADQKQDRVIVGPALMQDVGKTIRTFKLQFQAPPNPGLYTFQLYMISDVYKGMDQLRYLQLEVVEPGVLDVRQDEDEISEPEVDSLTALMKGVASGGVVDDDESSSEEEGDEGSEIASSSSDSDSD